MSRLVVVAFLLSACSSKAAPDWKATGYGRDLEKLCNAEKYSGALDQPEDARSIMVARWLGPNLETNKMRAFLVKIQPLNGAAKGDAMRAEAASVGLDDCPTAELWK